MTSSRRRNDLRRGPACVVTWTLGPATPRPSFLQFLKFREGTPTPWSVFATESREVTLRRQPGGSRARYEDVPSSRPPAGRVGEHSVACPRRSPGEKAERTCPDAERKKPVAQEPAAPAPLGGDVQDVQVCGRRNERRDCMRPGRWP